jgi:hypothetical protein
MNIVNLKWGWWGDDQLWMQKHQTNWGGDPNSPGFGSTRATGVNSIPQVCQSSFYLKINLCSDMLEKGKICFSYSPIDSQHGGFTNVFSQRTQAVHHGSAFGGFLKWSYHKSPPSHEWPWLSIETYGDSLIPHSKKPHETPAESILGVVINHPHLAVCFAKTCSQPGFICG